MKEIDNRPTTALTPKELRQLVYKLQDQVNLLKERRKPKERIIIRTNQDSLDEIKSLKKKLESQARELSRFHKERETETKPIDDAKFIEQLTGIPFETVRESKDHDESLLVARVAFCYLRRMRGDYTSDIGNFINRSPSLVSKNLDMVETKLDKNLLNKIDERLNLI